MRDRFRLRSPLAHSWPKHTPTRVCAHTPLKCIRMAFSFGLMTPSRPLFPSTTTPCCVGYVLHIHRRRCFFFSIFPEELIEKKKAMDDLFVRSFADPFPGHKKREREKKWGWIDNTTRVYTDRFIINGTTYEMCVSRPNQKKEIGKNQGLNSLFV